MIAQLSLASETNETLRANTREYDGTSFNPCLAKIERPQMKLALIRVYIAARRRQASIRADLRLECVRWRDRRRPGNTFLEGSHQSPE
jgi:hypothetical protein